MKFMISFPLVFLALISPTVAATNQLKCWYPEYQILFNNTLHENCSDKYADYLAGRRTWTQEDRERWRGLVNTDKPVFPPANCILDNTSEWMKSHMASAAVLLGLTPPLLAAIGPSAEEISSLFVVARKPVLGFLLGIGAPSLSSYRHINYKKAIEELQDATDHVHPFSLQRPGRYLVIFVELFLATGAVANIVENSYRLGIQTICVTGPHLWYLPLLWVFLGTPASLISTGILWYGHSRDKTNRRFSFKDSRKSTIASWFLSAYIAFHVTSGTLIFSSLIFITVLDAMGVVSRYVASVVVCRAILMYELALVRDKHRGEDESFRSRHTFGALPTSEEHTRSQGDAYEKGVASMSASA